MDVRGNLLCIWGRTAVAVASVMLVTSISAADQAATATPAVGGQQVVAAGGQNTLPVPPLNDSLQQVGFFWGRNKSCQSCQAPQNCLSCQGCTSATPQAAEAVPPKEAEEVPSEPTEQAPLEQLPSSDFDLSSAMEAPSAPEMVVPNMIGDFLGVVIVSEPSFPGQVAYPTNRDPATYRTMARYKVADNNSPIPQWRLFYSSNFYNDPYGIGGHIQRSVPGVEMMLIQDMVSLEVRTSINSFNEFPNSDNNTEVGDVRTTIKSVIWRNQSTVVAGGMGIGWPVNKPPAVPNGVIYLSPYIGYLYQAPCSPWFLQGFQQIDFPLERHDQILMHTDVGLGFWAYRNPCTGIALAPTIELHAYTPFCSKPSGPLTGLIYNDAVNVALGGTAYLRRDLTVAMAAGLPLAEKDYDVELQLQFNWRF